MRYKHLKVIWSAKLKQWFMQHPKLIAEASGTAGWLHWDLFVMQDWIETMEAQGYQVTMSQT